MVTGDFPRKSLETFHVICVAIIYVEKWKKDFTKRYNIILMLKE